MSKELMNRAGWLIVIIASALLLAACSSGTSVTPAAEPADEPESPTSEPVDAEEVDADNEVDANTSSDDADHDENVQTDGELPSHLSNVARRWDTDWSRHTISYDEIISGGVPRDGIRSIDAPSFISIEEAENWLVDTEPVIALEVDGEARAYPLQILTRHEIVNDEIAGKPVAVTFCPLCNAAVVFDRRVDDEVYAFGVSGLLRNSDLIMYDRTTESLWQQFTGEGIVGEHAGDQLTFIPSNLVSFEDFKEAYPTGQVLGRSGRTYGQNPYAYYDETTGSPFLFRGDLDSRLPSMMRVVGLNINDEIKAYAYNTLAEVNVVNDTVGGQDIVIFYKFGTNSALGAPNIAEAKDVGAAAVYDPKVDGQTLTFALEGDNFVDEQTGTSWNILGQAVDGPLEGEQLTSIKHSNDFWFAWSAFYPETEIYSTS